MIDCLNRLKEFRNYTVGVLKLDVANKVNSIVGRSVESQMLRSDIFNVVIIFLIYIQLSTHVSFAKDPKQNIWFDKINIEPVVNVASHFAFTKSLLHGTFGLQQSIVKLFSNRLVILACKMNNKIVAALLQLIQRIKHAWSASAPHQNDLLKPTTFLLYNQQLRSTKVML